MDRDDVVIVGETPVNAARLLRALHNNTRAIGLGKLHDLQRDITLEEVLPDLERAEYFSVDYYYGRPLKVHCFRGTNVINPYSRELYDSVAGAGAFDRAVQQALACT